MEDIRWIQRFDSFLRALSQLEEAYALAASRRLSRLEEQGSFTRLNSPMNWHGRR